MNESYRILRRQAFETADVRRKQGHSAAAAKLHVVCALLLAHPIRIRSLLAWDIEQHFVRNPEGRLSHIRIDPGETKP